MVTMVSRRRLEEGDFDAWKVRFEGGSAARKAAGCRGVRRFHGIEDHHELLVIFDWDSAENAKAFVNSKVAENEKLTNLRPGGTPMLENIFMVEMEPLES